MNQLLWILGLIFITTATAFAQTVVSVNIKKETVPTVVLKSITEDFPEAMVVQYSAIPITIIDEHLYIQDIIDGEEGDADTYLIELSGKNGAIRATYDRYGNLISSSEKLKNVPLPRAIQLSIGRHFPEWAVVGDKIMLSSLKNGSLKTHYRVRLKKGKETHRVLFDANGNILRGASKAKKHRQIKVKKNLEKWLKTASDADDYDTGK